jgi:hypothetical protein
MKYLIFLLGFIFSFLSGSAQTHDYTSAGCRYFKCPTGQHCAAQDGAPGCPACRKDFDDEIKAVAEESKRKADEKAAQDLVEKQKRDEELKKIAEQRKADENNKISIVSPNPQKTTTTPEKASGVTNNTIMIPFLSGWNNTTYGKGGGFMDTTFKVLFYSTDVVGGGPNSYTTGFGDHGYISPVPMNIGIIALQNRGVDIVYPNRSKEFNTEDIYEIDFIKDDWFLIRMINNGTVYLYNFLSKEKIKLPSASYEGPRTSYYNLEMNCTPIYQESNYNFNYQRHSGLQVRRTQISKSLKESVLKKNPDKVNEDLLKENLFCLIISDDNLHFRNASSENSWDVKFVFVSKTGKITIK